MTLTCQQTSLNDQAATHIVNAACDYARTQQLKICVGVVDLHGNLLAFRRINGAPLHSISIAQDKAYTAVSFGIETVKWPQRLENKPHTFQSLVNCSRMSMLGGGVPIKIDGQIVAAVGVSGASEQQDINCANAGVAALNLPVDNSPSP
jgi:uncharacterized protein GlcG (DUF336 family)